MIMNDVIKRQWDFIIKEAGRLGMPVNNTRGIVREFLQVKILKYIFKQKASADISFMGGTCLRLVYDLNRFSEDLDFDIFIDSPELMPEIVRKTAADLKAEGYTSELQFAENGNTADIKFPGLPYAMGLSSHENEKLQIKVDWDFKEKVFTPEVYLLSGFGIIQRISANSEPVIFAEKIAAIIYRKRPIPRDFFDIMELMARNITPDAEVLRSLNIQTDDLPDQIIPRFKEMNIKQVENELKPFLFDNTQLNRLDLFEDLVIKKLC